jgi:hypothetical protein
VIRNVVEKRECVFRENNNNKNVKEKEEKWF